MYKNGLLLQKKKKNVYLFLIKIIEIKIFKIMILINIIWEWFSKIVWYVVIYMG